MMGNTALTRLMVAPLLFSIACAPQTPRTRDGDIGLRSANGPWVFIPAQEPHRRLPNVLLIGDSIMNAYRWTVYEELAGKANVDAWLTPLHLKSEELHEDLARVLEQRPYNVIHFNIGLHGWPPGRIMPEEYEPFLRAYVEIIRSHSESARLIWASTTQITVEGDPTQLNPEHNQTIVTRNAIADEVMRNYGVAVNDLHGLMGDHLELGKGDTVHWQAEGSAMQGRQVAEQIREALEATPQRPPVFFVSPEGRDRYPGTRAKPFRTLEMARDALREYRAESGGLNQVALVYLRGGVYEREETFALSEQDSGTAKTPVIWRAFPGEEVRIAGGRTIAASEARPVSGNSVRERIVEASARGRVQQVDLEALDIEDYGALRARGFRRPYGPSHMELFVDGQAMRLAQWPNPGEPRVPIGEVLEPGSHPRQGDFSDRGGVFRYEPDRPALWKHANDVWISGFFNNGYADDTVGVARFDFDDKTITTAHPHMYQFRSGQPWNAWYASNLLEEIDQPGEYYVDRETGMLYFLPPEGYDPASSHLQVSILDEPLVALEGASHVHLQQVCLEASRGMGVYIERGEGCRVAGCTLRNLGIVAVCMGKGTEDLEDYAHQGTAAPASRRLGSWHEHIYENPVFDREGGRNHGVVSCDIYNIAAGAISLGGGNRKTLDAAGNFVRNCHIHDFNRLDKTYRAGVNIDGVGNRVEHCLIHDCPNNAIYIHGNDHVVAFNEIHHAVMDADDMGAIYLGRDPSEYGTRIAFNFFHHNGRDQGGHGTQAIFFDDGACGTTVHGNVIVETAGRALKSNGAIDNIYTNNILVDNGGCDPGDGWGPKRWHDTYGTKAGEGFLNDRLRKHVDILEPPYSTRYPELPRRYNASVDEWHGNTLQRNVSVRSGNISENGDQRRDNWVTDEDPGFVDAAAGDFALKPDSDVYKHIPEFEEIPFEAMGLRRDPFRSNPPERVGFEE